MKHLTGLDAAFLYLESPEMPMHVGSLHVYSLPPGFKGDFYEAVKQHIRKRMHLAPVFHRKLALMPFDLANPMWIEDDDIDLDYHVRSITLPKPGTLAQLENYVGRLHSSLIDRSRPLWEMYVFDGLAGGDVAFYSKMHHAAIDGQAGVAVANAVLDITPEPRVVKPVPARPGKQQYQLGVGELVGAAFSNLANQYVKLFRTIPAFSKTVAKTAAGVVARKDAVGNKKPSLATRIKNLSFGPKTHLNVSITNQRAFATASIPLGEVKAIGRALDATINDMVLLLCSSALRKYLLDYGALPPKSLVAAVPVSLREAGDTSSDNQAFMLLCQLATQIKDPLARLAAIKESIAKGKAFTGSAKSSIPLDFPSLGAPWLMSGLASLYGRSRLANSIPPIANVVISNVPGPQMPLYMAGATMKTFYPVSIVVHGVALNITVESYNGSLDFGLIACRRAAPDVRDIAKYLAEAHEELKVKAGALVQVAATKAMAPVPAPATAQAKPARKVSSTARGAAPVRVKQATPKNAVAKKAAAKKAAAKKAAAKKAAAKKAATNSAASAKAKKP